MAKRDHTSLYFADDKDISDLLLMSKQVLTQEKLLEVARARGIVFSAAETRDSLIKQISMFPFSWSQLLEIANITDRAGRSEKVTSATIPSRVGTVSVQTAAAELRDTRGEARGEIYDVKVAGLKTTVTVKYSEIDTTKTRLCQRVQREVKIQIEHGAGETVVRHEASGRAGEIAHELIARLMPSSTTQEARKISLAGIQDPVRRTGFFLHLITTMKGFTLEDVRSVRVNRIQDEDTDDEEDGVGSVSQTTLPHDVDDDSVKTGDKETFAALVRQAALHGQNIHLSKEYKRLTDEGFFLSRVLWTAREKKADGIRAAFEAEFAKPSAGTEFRYSVRSIYDRRTTGDQELKKSRRTPSDKEREEYGRLVEAAAEDGMRTALSSKAGAKKASPAPAKTKKPKKAKAP